MTLHELRDGCMKLIAELGFQHATAEIMPIAMRYKTRGTVRVLFPGEHAARMFLRAAQAVGYRAELASNRATVWVDLP